MAVLGCLFCFVPLLDMKLSYTPGAVLGKALGGSSHADKCRDHAPYLRMRVASFAMRRLIDIVGVVVIEHACAL